MTENFGIIYHCPPSSPTIHLEKVSVYGFECEKLECLLFDFFFKGYKMRSTTSGLSHHQQSKRKSIESDHPNVVLIGIYFNQYIICLFCINLYIPTHVDHVRQKPSDAISNKSDMRASSLQLWFQSSRNSNATSLDRYLSTIRLEDMSIQDIMAIENIRQSLLDKETNRQYHPYIF